MRIYQATHENGDYGAKGYKVAQSAYQINVFFDKAHLV
jgi:hypothetical protein